MYVIVNKTEVTQLRNLRPILQIITSIGRNVSVTFMRSQIYCEMEKRKDSENIYSKVNKSDGKTCSDPAAEMSTQSQDSTSISKVPTETKPKTRAKELEKRELNLSAKPLKTQISLPKSNSAHLINSYTKLQDIAAETNRTARTYKSKPPCLVYQKTLQPTVLQSLLDTNQNYPESGNSNSTSIKQNNSSAQNTELLSNLDLQDCISATNDVTFKVETEDFTNEISPKMVSKTEDTQINLGELIAVENTEEIAPVQQDSLKPPAVQPGSGLKSGIKIEGKSGERGNRPLSVQISTPEGSPRNNVNCLQRSKSQYKSKPGKTSNISNNRSKSLYKKQYTLNTTNSPANQERQNSNSKPEISALKTKQNFESLQSEFIDQGGQNLNLETNSKRPLNRSYTVSTTNPLIQLYPPADSLNSGLNLTSSYGANNFYYLRRNNSPNLSLRARSKSVRQKQRNNNHSSYYRSRSNNVSAYCSPYAGGGGFKSLDFGQQNVLKNYPSSSNRRAVTTNNNTNNRLQNISSTVSPPRQTNNNNQQPHKNSLPCGEKSSPNLTFSQFPEQIGIPTFNLKFQGSFGQHLDCNFPGTPVPSAVSSSQNSLISLTPRGSLRKHNTSSRIMSHHSAEEVRSRR